jgi:hypothetical protein
MSGLDPLGVEQTQDLQAAGIIDEGFSGLLLGFLYLGTGCNLSVPVIAHGVTDTVDVLLIFFGQYPGL